MLVVYFDVFHAKKAEKARKLRQNVAYFDQLLGAAAAFLFISKLFQ